MIASGEAEAGGVLTIDLAAIAANWKRLYGMTVPVECAAVVKADAYGCGIERVVPALKKVGCRTFFVADIAEGRRVRAAAPEAVIYVLNGLMPSTARAFADANLRPVINSPTELAEWDTFVAANSWRRRRRAAHRHRHEPARPDAGGSGRHRAAHPVGHARLQAADEPLRLRRDARPSDERPADPAVPRDPHPVPRRGLLARQFGRNFPRAAPRIATWCGPASRCSAATRSPARKTPCARWSSSRAGSRRCARSRRATPSATARAGPRHAPPGWRSSRSAMATAISARPPPARASRRRM